MSKQHGAREQKRLAKQKAKRTAKQRQIARASSPNPAIRLKEADRWPVVACYVPEELWEVGIGNLLIARRMPSGQLACGVFLVDVFCLGVKDAVWTIVEAGQFESFCEDFERRGPLANVAPEYFAKLVYRAADYAQSLGFAPHPDFRHAQRLLAGIDPSLCAEEFQFGKDGQPLYISGPNESRDKARIIAARVQARGGHYVVSFEPFGEDEEFAERFGEFLEDCSDDLEHESMDDEPQSQGSLRPWQ